MNAAEKIDREARAWFVRLNDGEASEADWLGFLDWVEADDAHRLAYDRIEQLWVQLDEPIEITPANDERPQFKPRRAAWLYPGLAAAAAVALAVGVGTSFIGDPAQHYQAGDQPRTIQLEDGSQIVLNRHSEMTVHMKRGSREITLDDGEAAFDVAHDASRPFIVSADGHDVRVLGTAFNVLSHDGRFSVGVARGVVSVTPKGEGLFRLTAGDRVDQSGENAPVLSRVDPARVSAWRDGVLVYRNANVAEIADDLSRYLDKPVTVSPSTLSLRYTGVIQLGDETTMLNQIEDILPVKASDNGAAVALNPRGAD
ncbi:FecR family protein [Brevundimonas kwangchunensis]|uniref:FecR family protein n=1 Tax=Brevundimonas kwangchunensis TaxID=322163 RepID=A0ABN1H4Y1_9CAUL